MNDEIFSEYRRRRLSNPTYLSGGVFSAMTYPTRQVQQMSTKQSNAYIPSSPSRMKSQQYNNPEQNGTNRLSSNLSNYGSSSLKNIHYGQKLSDRQVHLSQQKKYDIINLHVIKKQQSSPNVVQKKQEPAVQRMLNLKTKGFESQGYNGISTSTHNLQAQKRNQIKYRPFYLNNADQIFL